MPLHTDKHACMYITVTFSYFCFCRTVLKCSSIWLCLFGFHCGPAAAQACGRPQQQAGKQATPTTCVSTKTTSATKTKKTVFTIKPCCLPDALCVYTLVFLPACCWPNVFQACTCRSARLSAHSSSICPFVCRLAYGVLELQLFCNFNCSRMYICICICTYKNMYVF